MWTTTVTESANSAREPAEIIADATTTLVVMGFTVTTRTPTHLEAQGPGWSSSKQPPMRAASQVTLDVDEGVVRMRAELGGLARMQRFGFFFPLGMVALFAALIPFGVLQHRMGGVSRPSSYADLAGVAVFLIPMSVALNLYVRRVALRGVTAFVRTLAA